MTFWQFLNDNLWWMILWLLIFGGSIGGGIRWLVKQITKHRQEMARIKYGWYAQPRQEQSSDQTSKDQGYEPYLYKAERERNE